MAKKDNAANNTDEAPQSDTSTALVASSPGALVDMGIDFGADAGGGMEGTDKESFAIPFLMVLQKNSPQCEETDAKFLPEARDGMFFNSVTQQLYEGKDQGVRFVPCAYQRRFLRWGARGTESAGFKGEIMPDVIPGMIERGELIEQDGRLYVPLADGSVNDKKCDVVRDVRNHFGLLLLPDGAFQQVLLVLGSTQIKKSKALMSNLNAVKVRAANGSLVTPPTWANVVRITTVPESNDKGSWKGVACALEGFVGGKDIYDAGKAFHDAIVAGTAGEVRYDQMSEGDAAPTGDDRF